MGLLSIDPGVNAIAWAVWGEGLLENCGYTKTEEFFNTTIFDLNRIMKQTVIVEFPQVYTQKNWKGDPEDLLQLARVCGRMQEIWIEFDSGIEFVRPREWKGQTPKSVTATRVVLALEEGENEILKECLSTIPKGQQHNVYDAIGIGLWWLKKNNKRPIYKKRSEK